LSPLASRDLSAAWADIPRHFTRALFRVPGDLFAFVAGDIAGDLGETLISF
jgi:hypothetical protein